MLQIAQLLMRPCPTCLALNGQDHLLSVQCSLDQLDILGRQFQTIHIVKHTITDLVSLRSIWVLIRYTPDTRDQICVI